MKKRKKRSREGRALTRLFLGEEGKEGEEEREVEVF